MKSWLPGENLGLPDRGQRGVDRLQKRAAQARVFSVLPQATSDDVGRRIIVRATGQADKEYLCLRSVAGVHNWILTHSG